MIRNLSGSERFLDIILFYFIRLQPPQLKYNNANLCKWLFNLNGIPMVRPCSSHFQYFSTSKSDLSLNSLITAWRCAAFANVEGQPRPKLPIALVPFWSWQVALVYRWIGAITDYHGTTRSFSVVRYSKHPDALMEFSGIGRLVTSDYLQHGTTLPSCIDWDFKSEPLQSKAARPTAKAAE